MQGYQEAARSSGLAKRAAGLAIPEVLRAVDAAEVDTFGLVVVQNLGGDTIEDGDDGAKETQK